LEQAERHVVELQQEAENLLRAVNQARGEGREDRNARRRLNERIDLLDASDGGWSN
jgi:hypothetical protein